MVTCLVALALPVSGSGASWLANPALLLGPAAVLFISGSLRRENNPPLVAFLATAAVALGGWSVLSLVHDGPAAGDAGPGIWMFVVSLGIVAWYAMAMVAALASRNPTVDRLLALAVPAIFGVWLLFLWEIVVVGFGVPRVLLPAPSAIAEAFTASLGTLGADFHQTFVRAVIPGYLMGNCFGFLIALLADRVPFLRRGLLPLGNLVSAIPIVGIAPIMVMWFGFDWQSKAAVVVIMTFFPMLVNTIAGLSEAGTMERDLMRSYAASHVQELVKLRLPGALPFVFNALKINSTLALIGAIVAEFFGTPIVGMGFRISTEVGRMNIDMVWATIVVAALAGSVFYGALALLERVLTFWHPSYRRR